MCKYSLVFINEKLGNGLPRFMGCLKVQTESFVLDSLFQATEGRQKAENSQQEFVGDRALSNLHGVL